MDKIKTKQKTKTHTEKTDKKHSQSSKKENKIFIILSRRTGCLGRRCGGNIGEVKQQRNRAESNRPEVGAKT